MRGISVYLHFNGNCEEAFLFYQSIFGGEFKNLSRYKDAPAENAPPDQDLNKIMHVTLPLGSHSDLLGSDIPGAFPKSVQGSNYYVHINAESEEEAKRFFDLLNQGGVIAMPIDHTFWGAYFGMVIDKYGVQWMVNYEHK